MEQSFRCSTHEAALSKAALLKTSAHALVFFSHGSCYRIFFSNGSDPSSAKICSSGKVDHYSFSIMLGIFGCLLLSSSSGRNFLSMSLSQGLPPLTVTVPLLAPPPPVLLLSLLTTWQTVCALDLIPGPLSFLLLVKVQLQFVTQLLVS